MARRAACSPRSTISTPRRGSRRTASSTDDSEVDAVALLCRLHESYDRVARSSAAPRIAHRHRRRSAAGRVEPAAAERMFARLLAGTIGLAGEGETIDAALTLEPRGDAKMLRLALDRPRAIAGVEEAALLDPGYSPDGDWPGAPALGLGFALRLVRNLAEAVGGALVVDDARFASICRSPHRPARASCTAKAPVEVERARRHAIGSGGACSSTVEPAAHNG